MNADCCICEDVFTGVDGEVVHSTLCGHIFHFVCLKEWLRRSKTCPQCRSYVSEHNTVKLYFQMSSGQGMQTPRVLENEIANLKRQMVLQSLDVQTLIKEKQSVQDHVNGLRSLISERDMVIQDYERKITESEEKLPSLIYKISLQEAEISKLYNQKLEVQLENDGLRVSLQRSEQLNKNQEKRLSMLQKRVSFLDHQICALKKNQWEIADLRRRLRRYERATSNVNKSTNKAVEPQLCSNDVKTDSTNSCLVENSLMILGDEKVNNALRFLGGEEAENSLVLLGDADVFKNLGMRLEGSDEDKKSSNEEDDEDSVILLSDDDDDDDVTTLDVVRKSKRAGNNGRTSYPKRRKGSQSEDDDSVILLSDDEADNSLRLLNNEEVTENLELCRDTTSNEYGNYSLSNEMNVAEVIFTNEAVDNSLLMLSNDDILKNLDICHDLPFENSVISNANLVCL